MATVAQVANASLKRILVQAGDAQIEADEAQDFILAMNAYMLDLDANGIQLGYTEVSGLGDDVTVPTGALRGVIANMAIEVASDYGGTVSAALAAVAKAGLHTMRLIGQRIGETAFPSTLPLGSGNESDSTWGTTHFFPDLEAEILAETTGAIGLEVSTEEAISP